MDKTKFSPNDSFVYKTERPWPNPRMKTGAIVGHTTADSATIWVRTGKPGKYKLVLLPRSEDGNVKFNAEYAAVGLEKLCASQGCISRDFEVADFKDDTTHVERFSGLNAATRYQYCVFSAEQEDCWRPIIGRDRVLMPGKRPPEGTPKIERGLSFKTLATSGPFSFALFSCHNPYVEKGGFFSSERIEVERMEAWEGLYSTLLRHSQGQKPPAFVIAGGDQAYTDGRPKISVWNYLYKVMRKENGQLLPDEGTMLTWFRDIYRGYWGFPAVKQVYSHFPTYMMWDDHEIGDGWGSFDHPSSDKKNPICHEVYEEAKKKGMSIEEADELLQRMFNAAKEAYFEYEHSHNPPTENGVLHYGFHHNKCAFFALDGRGHRDVNKDAYRIHGEKQFSEFKAFVEALNPSETRFLFVLSAVPFLHMGERWFDWEKNKLFDMVSSGNRDDLRDGWEHSLHDEERKKFKEILWAAANRGIKVAILSGDVHASAAFSLAKQGVDLPIWQLTSSAITYHLKTHEKKVAELVLPASEDGSTSDGEDFFRHQLSVKSPYSIIQVNPEKGEAVFQMYGLEEIKTEGKSPIYKHNATSRVKLW